MTISAVILIKETLHSTIDWEAILPVLSCMKNAFTMRLTQNYLYRFYNFFSLLHSNHVTSEIFKFVCCSSTPRLQFHSISFASTLGHYALKRVTEPKPLWNSTATTMFAHVVIWQLLFVDHSQKAHQTIC